MRLYRHSLVLTLLLGGVLSVTPVASAQDFTTGFVVGSMMSSDGGDEKVSAADELQSRTIVDYDQGDTPVVTRVETFPANKWRQVDGANGGYIVCPGTFKDYFESPCRMPDDGINGFLGGSREAKAVPILDALEDKEGQPVRLRSIEVNGDTLSAKYQYVTSGQSTTETPEATEPEQTTEAGEAPASSSSTEQANVDLNGAIQNPLDPLVGGILEFMDSTLMKIVAMVLLTLGMISGIARQSISAFFMGIAPALMIYNAPVVFGAILGVDPAATVTDTGQIPGEPEEGGASILLMIVALAIPPILFSFYRSWQNRRDSNLDELLQEYRARQQGQAQAGVNNELASVDELAQRQREQGQDSEPVVVSTASPSSKVTEEEPVEFHRGKRKIILD